MENLNVMLVPLEQVCVRIPLHQTNNAGPLARASSHTQRCGRIRNNEMPKLEPPTKWRNMRAASQSFRRNPRRQIKFSISERAESALHQEGGGANFLAAAQSTPERINLPGRCVLRQNWGEKKSERATSRGECINQDQSLLASSALNWLSRLGDAS